MLTRAYALEQRGQRTEGPELFLVAVGNFCFSIWRESLSLLLSESLEMEADSEEAEDGDEDDEDVESRFFAIFSSMTKPVFLTDCLLRGAPLPKYC